MSDIEQAVKEKYGAFATSVKESSAKPGGCCGPTACGCGDPITSNLYSDAETSGLPADAVSASLGCGNPTALLALEPGQTVLDLGSGGGIDVLLSAKRVGPTGKAYGLDMTDEMLALARENQRKAGATNVEFLKGTIEAIPLPDNSVDVIISNCVINLSNDKDAVLREAFRVLKPGGRFYALTPAYPRPEAFHDPTHVNVVTDGTWAYFCGAEPGALMYGYTGRFELLLNEWVLHPEALTPSVALTPQRRFKRWRRGLTGGLTHIAWEFACVKPVA